jgi:multimeric flavodoxin WrbA
MKTLILNGLRAGNEPAEQLVKMLESELQAEGYEVNHIVVREQKIGNCAGDFYCWVRSPGKCNTDDDNRRIAAAVVNSDLVIFLTPVTFGGYSSEFKRAQDHLIQNISPFFTVIKGEVHHQKRYPRYADLLAIGWMEAPDAQAEAIFRNLVARNALNMYSSVTVTGIATAGQSETELRHAVQGWLADWQGSKTTPNPGLPPVGPIHLDQRTMLTAALLIGSPRGENSSSHTLGSYLLGELQQRGLQVEEHFIYTTLNNPERLEHLYTVLDTVDLVILATPLYIDSLPAPTIDMLERIAARRDGKTTTQRFVAVSNCGFPEPLHITTALAICARFAQEAGFQWAGGLAVGGGDYLHGKSLSELGSRVMPIRQGLTKAAEALAAGEAIPQAAYDLLARHTVPTWLYRLFGNFGWKPFARTYGAEKHLRDVPYQVK